MIEFGGDKTFKICYLALGTIGHPDDFKMRKVAFSESSDSDGPLSAADFWGVALSGLQQFKKIRPKHLCCLRAYKFKWFHIPSKGHKHTCCQSGRHASSLACSNTIATSVHLEQLEQRLLVVKRVTIRSSWVFVEVATLSATVRCCRRMQVKRMHASPRSSTWLANGCQ